MTDNSGDPNNHGQLIGILLVCDIIAVLIALAVLCVAVTP